jgi:hypothetical protein
MQHVRTPHLELHDGAGGCCGGHRVDLDARLPPERGEVLARRTGDQIREARAWWGVDAAAARAAGLDAEGGRARAVGDEGGDDASPEQRSWSGRDPLVIDAEGAWPGSCRIVVHVQGKGEQRIAEAAAPRRVAGEEEVALERVPDELMEQAGGGGGREQDGVRAGCGHPLAWGSIGPGDPCLRPGNEAAVTIAQGELGELWAADDRWQPCPEHRAPAPAPAYGGDGGRLRGKGTPRVWLCGRRGEAEHRERTRLNPEETREVEAVQPVAGGEALPEAGCSALAPEHAAAHHAASLARPPHVADLLEVDVLEVGWPEPIHRRCELREGSVVGRHGCAC